MVLAKHMEAPKGTKRHQNQEKRFDEIEPKYRLAIELKLRGVSYTDIAEHEQIQSSYNTIKHWFTQKGLLYDIYQWRKKEWKEEVKERFASVDSTIEDLTPDALEAYRFAIKKKKSWMAAESLLDRAGFKPAERLELVAPTEVHITYVKPDKPKDN